MITAKDLKAETEASLKNRGYPVNPHLPQIEELTDLRIALSLDVRRRCLILSSACGRAYGASYNLVVPWIDNLGLRELCTDAEVERVGWAPPTIFKTGALRPLNCYN